MGQQSVPGDAETHQSKAEWASEQRGEGEHHALADRLIFSRVTVPVDPPTPKLARLDICIFINENNDAVFNRNKK